jgi:hypothetical protein
MIRARFRTNPNDYRPVNWPVKHPYWCTGYMGDDSAAIVVAYADDLDEVMRNWPDATDVDVTEVTEYMFSGRFPKPEWFTVPVVGEHKEEL